MNFKDLEPEVIDDLDAGIAVQLKSAPGRGKSEFVKQLVAKLSKRDGFEWGFATCFLATMTPPDLMGYMFKGERDFGDGPLTVTEPTLPLWMITTQGKPTSHYKRGILFLDEYGQGEADVKRASAELLLNKQLGPWVLGGDNNDGWGIIAASNRASDRSGVTKEFDFVINRRGEYDISDDIHAWEEWANTNGVSPLTIAFAMQNPQIIFSDGVPDKQGPWCTPRSLVMLDRKMQVKQKRIGHFPDDAKTVEGAMGLIGAGAAQYFAFVRLEKEMPKFEDIIANPTKVKVPKKPDAQMLVVYNLAHRVTAKTLPQVIDYIENGGGGEGMGKEFAVTFAKAACKRTPELVIEPALRKWSTQNASLMAALTA
jgi:hypothetical protein